MIRPLLLALLASTATAFLSITNTPVVLRRQQTLLAATKDYNDDAFGLVFLGGGLATQDAAFMGTFLVLSAVAAVGARLGKASGPLPAAVAGMTLLVTPMIRYVLQEEPVEYVWVQVVLCSISMVYGFVFQKDVVE